MDRILNARTVDKYHGVWQSPFTLEISLSKDTFVVQNSKPNSTLVDFLIGIGGISNTIHLTGLVCAHVVAKRLYRRMLIKDLFMWQKPQKPPLSTKANQNEKKADDSVRNDLLDRKSSITVGRMSS